MKNKILQLDTELTPDKWKPRTLSCNSSKWRKLRLEVLERDKYTCRFCGFQANKFMVVDHINGDPSDNNVSNLGTNCTACDTIKHCGFSVRSYVCLVMVSSKLSQIEIVKKSRRFYFKHGRNPKPVEIDRKVRIISGTDLEEYTESSFQRKHVPMMPDALKNYKRFFTENFKGWQAEWRI